jgi:hypothetical protein
MTCSAITFCVPIASMVMMPPTKRAARLVDARLPARTAENHAARRRPVYARSRADRRSTRVGILLCFPNYSLGFPIAVRLISGKTIAFRNARNRDAV